MAQHSQWPQHGGATAALIRSYDWSQTALGPLERWPAHLKSIIDLCLGAGRPTAIWWGPDLIQIYNDACLPLLRAQHPLGFGIPAPAAWPSLWYLIAPIAEEVLRTGEAKTRENVILIPGEGRPHDGPIFAGSLSLSPLRDPAGQIAGIFVTGEETTGQVRAEVRLRANEARLAAIFSLAAVGLSEIDLDGRFLRVNDELCCMLGRTREEVLTIGVPEVTHPDDLPASLEAFGRVVATGEVASIDKRYRHPDGTIVWANSSLTRLDDETGQPVSVLVVTFDLSARKAAEAALLASEARLQALYVQEQAARAEAEEASRLKDEFLATVSHELRTPLTAILGYAQLLLARPRDEVYTARIVERMVQSARAQSQLIEDLLDVSRFVSGKLRITPRPTDLIAVVHAALDTVAPASEARGHQVVLDLRPEASAIIGDPGRLQQVVWNLLANAIKFTPAGGTIVVRLERDGGEAVLTVRDTGQGIPPEFLPFVFDRFRQGDSTSRRVHGGLGLGLAIVRHLVELHGGSVEAASGGVGAGATFTVRLPLAQPEGRAASAVAARGPGDPPLDCPPELCGLRVLVVDDRPEILEMIDDVLSLCGSEVRRSLSAREALEQVRSWRPDALIADIAMPVEDGYWLIQAIRALPPEEGGATPAVALTAYVRAGEAARALAEGFQQFLARPVEPDQLREALARLVRSAPGL